MQSSVLSSLRGLVFGTTIAMTLFFGYLYVTDTRAGIHLFVPGVLRWIYEDAEDSHEVGNRWLKALYKFGLHPRERYSSVPEEDLSVEVRLCAMILP